MRVLKKGGEAGFSLVEVVVATVILSTVIVGILRAFISANLFVASQGERTAAADLARQQLEDLYEEVRQDKWNLSNQKLSPGTTLGAASTSVVDGVTYTRSYTVSSVNDGPTEAYRKVEVTVTW